MNGQKEGFETPIETSSSKNPPSMASRFKDPRVVRVSKAVGGKDRHSKVCTVRGLRDRRVRLSVPTAIQLYDLQERLGLNQPSKVVDWLLNAAKREIDELPPLQIPQGMFSFGNNHGSDHYNLDQPMLNFQEFGSVSQLPSKQGLTIGGDHRDEDWARNQDVDWHGFGLLPFQPTVASGSHHHHHHHQVLVYHQPAPGTMSTQSYLPLNSELDQKHEVGFQRSQLSTSLFGSAVDSSSQPVRQIDFNMTANLLPSQDRNDETGA